MKELYCFDNKEIDGAVSTEDKARKLAVESKLEKSPLWGRFDGDNLGLYGGKKGTRLQSFSIK